MHGEDSEWTVVTRKRRQSNNTSPVWDNSAISWAFDSTTAKRYYAFPCVGHVPKVGEPLPAVSCVLFHVLDEDRVIQCTLVQLRDSGMYAYLLHCEDHHFGDGMGLYEIYLAHSLDDLFHAYPKCKELYDNERFPTPIVLHSADNKNDKS